MKILLFLILWLIFSGTFLLIYNPREEASIIEKTFVVIFCLPYVIIEKLQEKINKE